MNWVEREVRLALARATSSSGRFPFIPILAAQAESSAALPSFAQQFQGVCDVENRPEEFQKLVASALGGAEAGQLALEAKPFFGLKAIDEMRSHLFFGRARETQALVEQLRTTTLLMVTGESGSGKSSLVRAGLIPQWRGGVVAELQGRRPEEEIWHVVEMRPTHDPRRSLGDAVFSAAGHLGRSAVDCGTFKAWAMGDDAEQRQPFVALLLDLTDPRDKAFAAVMTMRRDYYNLCSEFPQLYTRLEADNRRLRYGLDRMRDEDLRRSVTEPLKLAGVEPGDREALAQSVLRDVGTRPGDLALVQFALTEAWRQRREYQGNLLRAYAAVGRVEGALAGAAQRVYTHLLRGGADESEIAAVFIRLVHLGDTAGATLREVRRCLAGRFPPQGPT